MATVSDVEASLVNLIAATLYPTGSPPSSLGYPVKIYPGWPDPATLDLDMVETAPGVPTAAHVSVYPLPAERNTTRYPVERFEISAPAATYFLTQNGQQIVVGGAAPATYVPQNLAVYVNGVPYVAQAQSGDAPSAIASALAALIAVDVPSVQVAGATITLPPAARIGALVTGSTGATVREVRRQQRQFQLAVWSSNPVSRAAIADAFDATLADTPRLVLADGSIAWLQYHGSREDDFTQKQRVYRRSLIYSVEFPTTITEAGAQVVVGEIERVEAGVLDLFDFTDGGDAVLLPLI